MKKYFTIENILLVLAAVVLFVFALMNPVPAMAIACGAALLVLAVTVSIVVTKAKENIAGLRKQLDDVRQNRDDYIRKYKEYWNKYDAKVSECSILEQKVRDLQAVAEMKDVPSAAAKPTRVIKRSGSGKKKKISEIKEAVKDITDNAK